MPMFKVNIEAIEKAGLRDDVIIMVGGAPVTQEYADAVGADGYASDAAAATNAQGAARQTRPLPSRESRGDPARRPCVCHDPKARVMHTVLRSASKEVVIGPDQPFCIIGERINPTGRKAFAEQLRAAISRRSSRTSRSRSPEARTSWTSTWASRSPTKRRCSPRRCTRPGAHRPADLHRLLRRRGARGRARRLRGKGARQLGHVRGGADGTGPAARQGARRGDHLPPQRRDRNPADGARSGSRSASGSSTPSTAAGRSRWRTSSSTRSP